MDRRRFVSGALAAAVAVSLPRTHAAILGLSIRVDSDIDALTGDGEGITLVRAAVQELGESLRGNLLLPGHAAYEEARRVINGQIDKRPALIVQPQEPCRTPASRGSRSAAASAASPAGGGCRWTT